MKVSTARKKPDTATPTLPRPLIATAVVLLLIALVLTVPGNPDWWQIVILGIVQGVTEWLPISSTAHLLITSDLLGYQGSIGGTFEIFIQIGTVLAVVAFYANDLFGQAQALLGRRTPEENAAARRLWLAVAAAFIPAAVLGVLLRGFIKSVLFDSPTLIATALIIGGLIFLLIEWLPRKPPRTQTLDSISPAQAIAVGIAQTCALVPGVSRSGSSIVGGLLAGLDRRSATAFSFYLSIPTLSAATLVDLLGSLDQIAPGDWSRLFLGAVVAMIVGYLTIGWLLRYISRNNFVSFGIYRIIAGVLILALVAAGRL